MSAVPSKITTLVRVDLDSDETKIASDSASFLKGWTFAVNKNPDGGEGYNAGVFTPREGSWLQTSELELPEGDNYCIGTHEATETNELYVFGWNHNMNHFIYRVNGHDGSYQMVYVSKYLKFKLDPRHYICEGRSVLKVVQYFNKATGLTEQRKLLCWVENNQPRMLSVEDAIATSSFDYVAHPFYDPLSTNQAEIDIALEKYINLAVPTPMECIQVTAQKRLEPDKWKQNLMVYKGWQWRLKFIDVYNRESEHGIISDRYFTVIGSNCLAAGNSMPRCVRLKFHAGNALVNKILVEFRTCANNSDLSVDGDWYLYDTIDKYDNSGNLQFWERPILNPYQTKLDEMNAANTTTPGTYTPEQIEYATAALTKYNDIDNTFEYTFCGDKQCALIPVAETIRTHNEIPRKSSTVFSLNEGIGLANNLRNFEPINNLEIKKVSVQAIPPSGECEDFVQRKIVVYAMIHGPDYDGNGLLKYIADPTEPLSLSLDACGGTPIPFPHNITWGNINGSFASEQGAQVFPVGQPGFVAYLAGTSYFAISEQVLLNTSTFAECPIGIFNFDGTPKDNSCDTSEGIILQKFEFTVPAGEYVVRIAHHRAKLTENYQETSTYLQGRKLFSGIPNAPAGTYGFGLTGVVDDYVKEMVADTSTADFINHTSAFIIQDCTDYDAGAPQPFTINATELYLREDEIGNTPIALMPVVNQFTRLPDADILKYTSVYTDHNGFTYQTKDLTIVGGGSPRGITVKIDRCDSPHAEPYYLPNELDSYAKTVCTPSPINAASLVAYLYAGTDLFPDENRRTIKGRILLCGDGEIGVGGVPIVPYHLRPAITNSDGEYTVIAHGRDGSADRPSTDILVISQNVCQYAQCDDECDFSFAHFPVDYIPCQEPPRLTTLEDFRLNVRGINKSGPQNGGRYQFAFVLHGDGRHNFAQTGEHLIVDVKSMIETHRFAHSTFQFTIDPSFRVPDWVDYMTFAISPNLNWDDFFMWSADRIAFVDAAGYENTPNPVKIRVYYESMIEYLKQSNLNSNTVWQFLSTDDVSQAIVGDVIEFYRNGDGTWLPKANSSVVRYDKEGKYIEIDYDSQYKDLKDGTLFKVIRPKICVNTDLFKELCPSIRVVAGVPQTLTGTLSYRDSFFLTRQFPVPVYIEDPNDPGVFIKTVSTRQSTYFYEHHSPSDDWGNHCWTRGRIFVKNPYERELHLQEIALSKPLLNRSNFNGLSYFESVDVTPFDEQEWGSITVVLTEINTCLVLCKRDNFIVGFSDNAARADAQGNVYIGSALGKFGQPQRKIGQNYGCQEWDINTIRKRNGIVVFLDRAKGDLVFHVYSQAGDVSVNGFKGWLTQKIARQNQNNQSIVRQTNLYFVGGADPKTNEYYLTAFTMPREDGDFDHGGDFFELPDENFYNPLDAVDIMLNETAVIDIPSASMKGFAAFTPEYYGSLEGFYLDRNIMAMRRGHSWSLHSGLNVPRLNYFGQQTKKILEFVVNISPEKVKRFMYLEIYNTNHKLIATTIVTEQGQVSHIPASYFDRVDRFYCAAFLCATNTPVDANLPDETGINSLTDGDPLYGRWAKIRLISSDADDPEYCELSGIVPYVIQSGKSAD